MRVSVILSTYNSPDWLEKVLWGYARQTHRDFEIVIADDGSTPNTAHRIDFMRAAIGLPIHHVWHPDHGFRKCRILNRAITVAKCDYLIFSDGDLIPREDFVATHVALARPGHFLSGGCIRLPRELSKYIAPEDIFCGRFTDLNWLARHGLRTSLKSPLRLTRNASLAKWSDRITPTRRTWNGGNASTFKRHLLDANGFDERLEWGGEDRELGERLMHARVRPVQIRHRAVLVHLDHDRGYVSPEAFARTQAIWRETRRSRATRTEFGIAQQRPEDFTVHAA